MNSTFQVGTCLIDSDSIYVITKIDKDRLFYSPSNPASHHTTVTGSIPLGNVVSAGLRHLLSKIEINQFITDLSLKKPLAEPIDPKTYKDLRNLNSPSALIPLLQQLWTSQSSPHTNFSGSNKDTLETILKHLSDEFSQVLNITPDTARKKIISALSQ